MEVALLLPDPLHRLCDAGIAAGELAHQLHPACGQRLYGGISRIGPLFIFSAHLSDQLRPFGLDLPDMLVAVSVVVLVTGTAAADVYYNGGSGNKNAFFDYCDTGGCAPMGYTWDGQVHVEYNYHTGPDGYIIDTFDEETQWVEVPVAPSPNLCDIEGAISTAVYEYHNSSDYETTIYAANQDPFVGNGSATVICGGATYPYLNATEEMIQPNANVWSVECTNLWYSTASASWQYNLS